MHWKRSGFFAPLVGALICGFGWKLIWLRKPGQYVATGLLFLAALLTLDRLSIV